MNRVKWISALVLLSIPLMAAAQMQPDTRVVTHVPFKFMVGNVTLPAGEYSVQAAENSQGMLVVRSLDTQASTLTLASADETSKSAPTSALVFHKSGGNYFLAGVRVQDSSTIYEFSAGKLEKELLSKNAPATEELLIAGTK